MYIFPAVISIGRDAFVKIIIAFFFADSSKFSQSDLINASPARKLWNVFFKLEKAQKA